MKNLPKLSISVVLTLVLATSALAGPSCPDALPGQIPTPPCSDTFIDISTEGHAPVVDGDLNAVTLTQNEISISDVATGLLLNFLSLY
jgi:hypothetical protein